MAVTRLGFCGPSAAYADFLPKSAAVASTPTHRQAFVSFQTSQAFTSWTDA